MGLAARTVVLVLGCTAFHLNLINMDRVKTNGLTRAYRIDFEPLRKWAFVHAMRPAGATGGGGWFALADLLTFLLQFWAALHAARWFMLVVSAVISRMRWVCVQPHDPLT